MNWNASDNVCFFLYKMIDPPPYEEKMPTTQSQVDFIDVCFPRKYI